MSDTVAVIIGHRLRKVEAVRRLKKGLARTNGHLGPMIAVEQETREGDTLRFRMRGLGQTAHRSVVALAPVKGSETPSSNLAQGGDAALGEEIERPRDGELRRVIFHRRTANSHGAQFATHERK